MEEPQRPALKEEDCVRRRCVTEGVAPLLLDLAPLYPHLEVSVHAFEGVENAGEILGLLLPPSATPQEPSSPAGASGFCLCLKDASAEQNVACSLGPAPSNGEAKADAESGCPSSKKEGLARLDWSLRECVWRDRRVFGVFCCNSELLLSAQQLQVAILAAVDAVYRRRTRTKTFFSEVLFRLAPHKNISLALKQYGVNAETRRMLIVSIRDTREGRGGPHICLNRSSQLERIALDENQPNTEAPLENAREATAYSSLQRLVNRARLSVVGKEIQVESLWLSDVHLTSEERRTHHEEKTRLLQKHFGVSAEETQLPGGLHAAVIGRIATKMI